MVVGQMRYYNETNRKFLNSPTNVSEQDLISGNWFTKKGIICDEIQIKTYPGVVLEINEEPIMIGETGVYNIPYQKKVKISSIKVDEASMSIIKGIDLAYLIINFMVQDDNSNNQEESGSSTEDPAETPTEDQGDESSSSFSENKSNHDHR